MHEHSWLFSSLLEGPPTLVLYFCSSCPCTLSTNLDYAVSTMTPETLGDACKRICERCDRDQNNVLRSASGKWSHRFTGRTSFADPEPWVSYTECKAEVLREAFCTLHPIQTGML